MLQGCSGNLATHFCREAISSLVSGTSQCLHQLFLQLFLPQLQRHQHSLAGVLPQTRAATLCINNQSAVHGIGRKQNLGLRSRALSPLSQPCARVAHLAPAVIQLNRWQQLLRARSVGDKL